MAKKKKGLDLMGLAIFVLWPLAFGIQVIQNNHLKAELRQATTKLAETDHLMSYWAAEDAQDLHALKEMTDYALKLENKLKQRGHH